MSDDQTLNEPPMIVDVVDPKRINAWFDYWIENETRDKTSGASQVYAEGINKIRRLALAGNSKAKRNNKAIAAVLADVFDGLAEDIRAGRIKVRTFAKGGLR